MIDHEIAAIQYIVAYSIKLCFLFIKR